jgi:coenzyme F420-reducing hydrogenase gamma subunit
MSRFVVFAVVLSLAGTTPAWAGETLLQSATRAVQVLARTDTRASRGAVDATQFRGRVQAAQTQESGLESAGLRKRTKILIAIGCAAAFAAIAYSIDHNDVNNTPSTLGTRKD